MWAWKLWIMACAVVCGLMMCTALSAGFPVVDTGLGGLVIFVVLVFAPKLMKF